MKVKRFAIEPIDVDFESPVPFLDWLCFILGYWRFVRFVKIIPTIRNSKTGEETQIGKPLYRLFYARAKVLKAP